ncbi:MAG: CapA family protein [Rhodospirillaceae bacterium]|nr:CapA family protein [Rhodospirillaceae bacterium]
MITFEGRVKAPEIITVAAVGDVLLHDTVQRYAMNQETGFMSLFGPVVDLIQGADVAFANLEGPAAAGVTKRGRVTAPPQRLWDRWVYTGYPMFNYHPSVVRSLKDAGFDVLQTANNHSMDRFAIGADKTIEALEAEGLKFTGTRKRGEMVRPWHAITTISKGDRHWRLAWLACSYGTNGIPDHAGQVLLCYKHKARVLQMISGLSRRDDIDAVLFTPHWGAEYRHEANRRQKALAEDAINAGATAVIGSHPHVMQPIEKYVTASGREGLVAYSLGNFVSNQIGLPRRSSIILMLGLKPTPSGKLQMAAMGWIPIWMRNYGNRMQVEAIDRAGPVALRNLLHLRQILPRANQLPASSDYWRQYDCCPDRRHDRLEGEY